ncbi:helix-turn-helix domain-containing protein [uncultured Thiodictyon sp.]
MTGALNPRPNSTPTTEPAPIQRAKIEAHFRAHRSLSTLEGRNELGIMHPAARVQELRDSGYRIDTVWTHQTDTTGRRHRVARYHWRGLVEGSK